MQPLTRDERRARRRRALEQTKRENRGRKRREAVAAFHSNRQIRNEIKLIRRARIFADDGDLQAEVLGKLAFDRKRVLECGLSPEQLGRFGQARLLDHHRRFARRHNLAHVRKVLGA